jgi:hypothetical protein
MVYSCKIIIHIQILLEILFPEILRFGENMVSENSLFLVMILIFGSMMLLVLSKLRRFYEGCK